MTKDVEPIPGWQGFVDPNYTPVPDDFFDVLLAVLTDTELRVLLYLMRRTYGFKKAADAVSLSQITDGIVTRDGRRLDHGTGLSRPGAVEALRRLEARGIILVERTQSDKRERATNTYTLRKAGQVTALPTVDNPVNYGRQPPPLPVVHPVTSQEPVVQDPDYKRDGSGEEIRTLRAFATAAGVPPTQMAHVEAAWRASGQSVAAWWSSPEAAELLRPRRGRAR